MTIASCVLHIPHSATTIPDDLRATLRLSDEALRRQLLLMTDWHTDALFALPQADAVSVRYPVSRLIVDPERFLDDAREVMAARGMGVIYTRTSDGAALRDSPTPAEREELIRRYYEPHHARLLATVDSARAGHEHCLVVDCHSFPANPLPCDLDQTPGRPDICLGTDEFHTPGWLVHLAERLFGSAGFSVEIDRPFSGAMVPSVHFGREASVRAIMIEINRSLYMNEESGNRIATFAAVARTVQDILLKLIDPCRA